MRSRRRAVKGRVRAPRSSCRRAKTLPAENGYVHHCTWHEQGLTIVDGLLGDYVYQAAEPHDFTIIYITSPVEESVAKAQQQDSPPYEMENAFGNFDQLELKRDLSSHVKRANTTSEGGLFERYQYFTPGIFMGMAAALPLFLILVVGIRALTSLEVSYFAFSKEMGPNAQKPGKQ